MKLPTLTTWLLAVMAGCTLAWASGFDPAAALDWPWWEVFLIALPIVGTSVIRFRKARGQ